MPGQFKAENGVDGATLAKLFDCDERTVRRLAAEGVIIRNGYGKYALAPSIKSYVRHLRARATERRGTGEGVDPVLENMLLKRSQRENVELKNEILKAGTVRVEDVPKGWARILQAVRGSFFAAPAKIRHELPHLTVFDEEAIDRVLRQQLDDAGLTDEPPAIDGRKPDDPHTAADAEGAAPDIKPSREAEQE